MNCDRDNPDSSAVDHKDEQLDGHGNDPQDLVEIGLLSVCKAFRPEPGNSAQRSGLLEACSC